MGYGVDCVCYSEYLSSRDYKDFEMIFKGLGLQNLINYYTIKELSDKIINKTGDIREMTLNAIS